MKIVLIPGLWLDARAWDAVLPVVHDAGHLPLAITLPGQGDGDADATLEDQLATVLAAVGDGPALVVGHSAASTLAWLAADRRAEAVSGVVMIGGIPAQDASRYAPFFDAVDGQVAFPGWEPFEGADSADLSEQKKDEIANAAHRVPETVTHAMVHYGNPERRHTPVTLVCPEFSPEQARAWIASGGVPELRAATHLSFVDIDTGHWPMFTAAQDLALVLSKIADEASSRT